MAFDLASAKPVSKGFDLASAKPVYEAPDTRTDEQKTKDWLDKASDSFTGNLKGAAEAGAHLVTGGFASIPAGLAGLGAAGVNTGTDALGKPRLLPSAGDTVDQVGQKLTYQPQTAEGQGATALIHKPMEMLHNAGDTAGQKVLDVTGSPEAATLVSTGIQALPMMIDPALRGVSRAVEAPSALERAAAPPPVAPEAPPASGKVLPPVTHEIGDLGDHSVKSANGSTAAQEDPANGYLRMQRTDTSAPAGGNGEGTARAVRLAQHANANGLRLASDVSVSPSAEATWNSLQKRGYPVRQNPATRSETTGNLVSADPRTPVFEMGAGKPLPTEPTEPVAGSPAGVAGKPQATPVTREMTPDEAHEAAVQTLLEHDVPLSTGQRDRGFLARQSASAGRAAETVLGPDKLTDTQGQAFTKAVLQKVGVDASRATPDVMQELQSKVNNEYNDVLAKNPTRVTKPMVDKLMETRQEILGDTDPTAAAPLLQQIDGIAAKIQAGPEAFIDGRAAQNSRAALGRMQQSPNPSVKFWAGKLKDQLDDAFEASADPVDATRMKAVRAVVQKTKQFEGAIDGQGIISPNKLYGNLTRKNERGQFLYGGGDQSLVDLAKAGKQVLPDKVGNSGTATRGVDVMKIMEILRHPVRATAEGAAAAAGRLNSVNAERGTTSAVRAAQTAKYLREQLGLDTDPGIKAPALNATAALPQQAPEQQQQRLRLLAQSLRQ